MSAKSKEIDPAKRAQHLSAAGRKGPKKVRPFPEWRQRIDCSKGMSILGLIAIALICLTGCETGKRDARVTAALTGSVARYETRVANANAREDAWEDATRTHHTREIQIAADRSVDIIAANPAKFPNQIAEVHRVDQVAAEKIAKQEVVLQKMRDLRAKDDAVNLQGARTLMAKVLQFDAAPAIDLTGTVQTILAPSAPPTIPEPGK